MTPHRRLALACASAVTCAALLSACTSSPGQESSATASPTASASAAVTPSASATATASPSPSASTTASPSPTSTPVASDEPLPTPTPEPGESLASVDVFITSWGASDTTFSAGAVIDGVIDEGARCTMELARGDRVVSATGTSVRSASSTACADGLVVALADLSSGTWSLTVEFRSDTAQGISEAKQVEIP